MNNVNDLRGFKEAVARVAAIDLDLKAKGICFHCGQPAWPRCSTLAGKREFAISGMCEICFDEMFKEEG